MLLFEWEKFRLESFWNDTNLYLSIYLYITPLHFSGSSSCRLTTDSQSKWIMIFWFKFSMSNLSQYSMTDWTVHDTFSKNQRKMHIFCKFSVSYDGTSFLESQGCHLWSFKVCRSVWQRISFELNRTKYTCRSVINWERPFIEFRYPVPIIHALEFLWDSHQILKQLHCGFGSCVWATHTYNKRTNYALTRVLILL